jgi:glutaminyl-peptide cyclotransferase
MKNSDAKGEEPARKPPRLITWPGMARGNLTWRPLMLWVFAGLVILAVGVVAEYILRFRSPEAQAAMLATPAPIDGDRAYKYLKQICAIGPRPAGSAANTKQRQLVASHFEKLGAKVTEQPFSGADPKSGEKVDMVNLVGSWHPERLQRVVIGAHYDTRPFPDEERDPAKRRLPFLGANDGASGVAMLMEIANHLDTASTHEQPAVQRSVPGKEIANNPSKLSTTWGVDLVLFDGEELVYGTGPNGQVGEYFLGSKEFARRYADGVDAREIKYRYTAGIVLDMVGDKNLNIDQEPHSLEFAPSLVREVWTIARGLKASAFRSRVGRAVLDDHLPLNNAGIPTIDIIDFDYPHWHTSQDLPENCSAASLEQVGKVVTAWLSQPRKRTTR